MPSWKHLARSQSPREARDRDLAKAFQDDF